MLTPTFQHQHDRRRVSNLLQEHEEEKEEEEEKQEEKEEKEEKEVEHLPNSKPVPRSAHTTASYGMR
jgi:hypothetical protein